MNNYKGIYFEDDNEKFQCPETGAHFKYDDLCRRMERIRIKRGEPKIEFDENGNRFYPDMRRLNSGSKESRGPIREQLSENFTNEDLDEHNEFSKKKVRNAAATRDMLNKPYERMGDETVKMSGSQLAEIDEKSKSALQH